MKLCHSVMVNDFLMPFRRNGERNHFGLRQLVTTISTMYYSKTSVSLAILKTIFSFLFIYFSILMTDRSQKLLYLEIGCFLQEYVSLHQEYIENSKGMVDRLNLIFEPRATS